ncbi:hypothetical protein PQG02_28900 [Nostoc sp. UHCC 0926]|uniref:hypothetical protein n=1 Tax=unclassified Nostoc TaxID=2593658 RepID=UPI00236276F3|nr:hypothetical protein [Nostoc sp. UHCC 0926]WDD32620.1 hypothetical protein PQG02_28900 [Nostoc sp. UHCC 0926]
MRYNIISPGVGARQCRAPTGVPYVNKNRYSLAHVHTELILVAIAQFVPTPAVTRPGRTGRWTDSQQPTSAKCQLFSSKVIVS